MDAVAKLRALAELKPTRRRRERAAAVMLQCDEATWARGCALAQREALLTEAELDRIGRVRRGLDANLRWQFLALTVLDTPKRAGATAAEDARPPDDPEAGKTWMDPDHAHALLGELGDREE